MAGRQPSIGLSPENLIHLVWWSLPQGRPHGRGGDWAAGTGQSLPPGNWGLAGDIDRPTGDCPGNSTGAGDITGGRQFEGGSVGVGALCASSMLRPVN